MKKLIFVFLMILISKNSLGGGGLVGNSPFMTVAFTGPEFRASTYAFDREASEIKCNSLMACKGEKRLSVGAKYSHVAGTNSFYLPEVSFEYGLNEKWSLVNLTSFSYSLFANEDSEHEMLLQFGVLRPHLSLFLPIGPYVNPGIAFNHKWKMGRWAWNDYLSFDNRTYTDGMQISEYSLIGKVGPSYLLGEDLLISVQPYMIVQYTKYFGSYWNRNVGFEASLSQKINEDTSVYMKMDRAQKTAYFDYSKGYETDVGFGITYSFN